MLFKIVAAFSESNRAITVPIAILNVWESLSEKPKWGILLFFLFCLKRDVIKLRIATPNLNPKPPGLLNLYRTVRARKPGWA
jgi:hypothetical protein